MCPFQHTLLFYQIEPSKNMPFLFLPSSIARDSQEPQTKRFFEIQRGILDRDILSDKHLDGAGRSLRIFWINSNNDTFIALQMKSFGSKKIKLHAGVKKCHFGNFSDRAGMAVQCQCGPQESLTGFQKFFLHWVPMNSQQCQKAKLERPHFLKVRSGKIIV